MTTSFITSTVSPDLIITTPTQLLAAYAKMLEVIGLEAPETLQIAATAVGMIINNLKTLNGQD